MKLVLVESPFAAPTPEGIEKNVRYARACLADCLRRGEAPFASHLLYTQGGVLRDEIPGERAHALHAGWAWGKVAAATVVYLDLGWSNGMRAGAADADACGRPIEFRTLGGEWAA